MAVQNAAILALEGAPRAYSGAMPRAHATLWNELKRRLNCLGLRNINALRTRKLTLGLIALQL